MKKKFETVILGGTFDELHKGHRALLLKAFEVGNHVLIGLSTDQFVNERKKKHEVAKYEERKLGLQNFLQTQKVFHMAEIFPLQDPFGPAISNPHINAIIVSEETESGAYRVNSKREERGLTPLKIIVIKMISSENGVPVSTTRIRQKEINHEGKILKS